MVRVRVSVSVRVMVMLTVKVRVRGRVIAKGRVRVMVRSRVSTDDLHKIRFAFVGTNSEFTMFVIAGSPEAAVVSA